MPGTYYFEEVIQQPGVPDVLARLLAQDLTEDGLLRARPAAMHNVHQLQLSGLVPEGSGKSISFLGKHVDKMRIVASDPQRASTRIWERTGRTCETQLTSPFAIGED